jgi:hypothetical protein
MDKNNWVKEHIRNQSSFKGFLIVYVIIMGVFLLSALTIT